MYEDLLNNFDESGLDPKNTVVRCATFDEAEIFLEYLYEKGIWKAKDIAQLKDQYSQYGSSTCYHLSRREWCDDSWYWQYHPRYSIVDFADRYKGYKETNLAISFGEFIKGVNEEVNT